MKKIFLAASLVIAMVAGKTQVASAHFYVTYDGQSKLTPMLVGDNLWRLDCLAADKDCCTVDWDTNEVEIYEMVIPNGEGNPDGNPGTYTGGVKPGSIVENPDGQTSVTMVVTDLVPVE